MVGYHAQVAIKRSLTNHLVINLKKLEKVVVALRKKQKVVVIIANPLPLTARSAVKQIKHQQ
jgi:hypothetical protein